MRFWLVPVFIFSFFIISIQSQTHWQSARILLQDKSIKDLIKTGIAFDHGHLHPGQSFDGDFTLEELAIIQKAGFKIEISPKKDLESRSGPTDCNPITLSQPEYPLPSNYQYGSMNGYLTLEEIYESLEIMNDLFPNLITVKKAIGSYRTKNGNPIYYVKISDNPNQDENEPEVLYTALHHAREPISMTQMMYFMWTLLENYGKKAEITQLINNRELFFIPCVNPDGYSYNSLTNPNGGGYWRKNRNPNADGIGTDLNRNYETGWGFNDDGSSPLGSSDVYRGVRPFSEAETGAMRDFCENRPFSIAMNYHSFGDLLIIPWGYLDKPTADSTHYLAMAQDMTRYNNFRIGTSKQTLDYEVNGVADDWMYGEQVFKHKTFAFTPEVGGSFWPERKDILPLNQSTQYMNFAAAWNAGECAKIQEQSAIAINRDTNYLNYNIQRTGILNAPIEIHLDADFAGVQFLDNDISINLKPGEIRQISIPYLVNGNPIKGDSIQFTAVLTTGFYTESSVVKKSYVAGSYFHERFNTDQNWFGNLNTRWNLTEESYFTPPNSLTDSPLKPMDPNSQKLIQNTNAIDLTTAKVAYLRFNAHWEMADDVDYAQVRVSEDANHFIPLCGRYTKSGSQFQDLGEPVYCGKQSNWVSEWIDLKDYIGKEIYLQFYISTGINDQNLDGYYVDEIEVFTDLTTRNLNDASEWHSQVFPIPAHDQIHVQWNNKETLSSDAKIELVSLAGKKQVIQYVLNKDLLEIKTNACVPGLYYLSIEQQNKKPEIYKVLIQ
ncbi:MAG: immune inhibitor A [Saprospiraceae bacterium]|nr:immune inhibitor A [Saprospiraceae bacterium]